MEMILHDLILAHYLPGIKPFLVIVPEQDSVELFGI
jgi:hypothetical protein